MKSFLSKWMMATVLILPLIGQPVQAEESATTAPLPAVEATRLALSKWIETQQIISKERREWQQAREILQARCEVVKNESAALREKIKAAEGVMTEAHQKKAELIAQNEQLKTSAAQLATTVTAYEQQIRHLHLRLPEPLQQRLAPLFQRIPENPAQTRVSIAERYQNVLGILNEINKANNEITVAYEVRTLADDKPAEVKTIYVGLAQAYYVSARGEAGIGRPGDQGWVWQPANRESRNVLLALEILQNKHSPAFVPLPVKIP